MSTEHQKYSLANQSQAISCFADSNGIELMRSYHDAGKSGLTLHQRRGLQALLHDVVCGETDFEMVLIYDVSRWGRFQDCDESAHYEYICREAGIRIEYCMEPFRNDGSPLASVMKSLKRVMAGEYSRELSTKIFAAKVRMIKMGFRAGGIAGYGYRRMVVDSHGKERFILAQGELKWLQTDRVILVPGPATEVNRLRWIFRQVVNGRMPLQIARELNRRGVPSPEGRLWTGQRISCMVENEKYLGSLVYNKRSTKLQTPGVMNPPSEWVRTENAFPPLVDPKLFWKAQARMAEWSTRITRKQALDVLRPLLAKHGKLSAQIINDAKGVPGSVFYEHRFGGLNAVYALLHYRPKRDCSHLRGYGARKQRIRRLRPEWADQIRARGAVVEQDSETTFRVNGNLRVEMLLCFRGMEDGRPHWVAQTHTMPRPDIVLIACLQEDGETIGRYVLMRGGTCCYKVGVKPRTRKLMVSELLAPLLDYIASSPTDLEESLGSPKRKCQPTRRH
ncbi:MAG: recombinase family protein [Phycisphaeraceae bacterium]|nr:recombinase family protein [Phycisphaeraceae bacterium]